jgi:uncharacterized membrane protein YedE/YeeE
VSRVWKQGLLGLAAGALFGIGLVLGGMTRPRKVIGFLDFGGNWDPSLACVMLGAVAVHFLGYRVAQGRAAPLLGDEFALPTRRHIDARLVLGSAVFGIGWGLAGYCPGPALVSLGAGNLGALVFVATMLVGMLAAGRAERWSTPNACAARSTEPGAGPREPRALAE